MLIEFSVGNFLSIKDRQTLRLDAASISEHRDQLIDAGRYKLLRSAVIYGANASGKSNVLKAMETMSLIVTTSSRHSSTDSIEVEPFRLSTETEGKPSYFEVLFLLGGIRYRYGFEVDRKVVQSEWLFMARKEQEKTLFLREKNEINVFKDFKEGKGLEERTRDNALFLAICDQFNGELAKRILEWFSQLVSISGISHERLRRFTMRNIEKNDQSNLLKFINRVDLGINNISFGQESFPIDDLTGFTDEFKRLLVDGLKDGKLTTIETHHQKFDAEKKLIGYEFFDLDKNESSGTNKLFDLSGSIFDTLEDSGVLIVDELDAKLHPLMTQAIIRLFNQPELNPNNAQLIFATHDTNLLSGKLFRRDQIYFTEKDQYGATSLYSLVEYQEEDGTKVRKDRSFEEDYIRGRYGAIPFIGDLSKLAS
ncbi:AAA family ATPase [Spirosoma foliorum]|uniref:AAA family ATPase n=1 Tax=Spirosoma foliorum TaxID=2710596 RepID=A0A7G5H4V8_9BACT|nr:ATP-binding protein [Spirosoma foliorum]QMW06150.1 AAA family ATPase [Spirosoma foliorum]